MNESGHVIGPALQRGAAHPKPEDMKAAPSNFGRTHLPRMFWIYLLGATLVAAGFADYTGPFTEANRPIDRSRDLVDPLAKTVVKAIPEDPSAARSTPRPHPARARRATPSPYQRDCARPPMVRRNHRRLNH